MGQYKRAREKEAFNVHRKIENLAMFDEGKYKNL